MTVYFLISIMSHPSSFIRLILTGTHSLCRWSSFSLASIRDWSFSNHLTIISLFADREFIWKKDHYFCSISMFSIALSFPWLFVPSFRYFSTYCPFFKPFHTVHTKMLFPLAHLLKSIANWKQAKSKTVICLNLAWNDRNPFCFDFPSSETSINPLWSWWKMYIQKFADLCIQPSLWCPSYWSFHPHRNLLDQIRNVKGLRYSTSKRLKSHTRILKKIFCPLLIFACIWTIFKQRVALQNYRVQIWKSLRNHPYQCMIDEIYQIA